LVFVLIYNAQSCDLNIKTLIYIIFNYLHFFDLRPLLALSPSGPSGRVHSWPNDGSTLTVSSFADPEDRGAEGVDEPIVNGVYYKQ